MQEAVPNKDGYAKPLLVAAFTGPELKNQREGM